mgnify:CR=1 FL=1
MIDLLLQYGLFLAKVVTVVVAALFIIVTIANVGERRRHHDEDGDIEVMPLNERLEHFANTLRMAVLDKNALKAYFKSQKDQEKSKEKPKVQTGVIDAKLDLHGLTLERAHKKFLEFIYFAIMDDFKKLLVITGKGNPGKIRDEFPKWCGADYLAPLISSCRSAELKHGGDGAFYVTLRK